MEGAPRCRRPKFGTRQRVSLQPSVCGRQSGHENALGFCSTTFPNAIVGHDLHHDWSIGNLPFSLSALHADEDGVVLADGAAPARKVKAGEGVARGGGERDPGQGNGQAMAVELTSQRRNGVQVSRMRKLAKVAPAGMEASEVESN
jgi:hypothetical protein